MNTKEKILNDFLDNFWFAPQDALLRATEAVLWSQQELKKPILDIGCGDGSISRYLFSFRKEIDVGIDLNPQAVKIARKSEVYKKVLIADATKMPFKSGTFQTVVSNSTFEHIREDIVAVREMSRVLKTGGRFLFTVPTPRLTRALKGLGVTRNQLNNYNMRVEHYHYRLPSEWKKILKLYGLKVEASRFYFPKEVVSCWFKLHNLSTFKPYRRELWSYLRDSPYGKLAPKGLITLFLKLYIKPYFEKAFEDKGCWLFINSRKMK